jgi:hypothetical protein
MKSIRGPRLQRFRGENFQNNMVLGRFKRKGFRDVKSIFTATRHLP